MADIVEVKVPYIRDRKDAHIIDVLVNIGSVVRAEDTLVTLECDKETMELHSPVYGCIVELCVKLGDKISEGALVAKIETDAAQVARAEQEARAAEATGTERAADAARAVLAAREVWDKRKEQSARQCTIHINNLEGKPLLSVVSPTANQTGADLSVAVLRNADLRNMYMLDAILNGADLEGADLQGAHLAGADLHFANLRGANLRGANLYGANLQGADLREADLSFCILSNAKLNDAMLSYIVQGDQQFYSNMNGAETEGANFCDARPIQRK